MRSLNRIPLGIVGAPLALRIIDSNLTGRFAGVAAVFEPDEYLSKKYEPLLLNRRVHFFHNYKKFLICGIRAVIISGGADRVDHSVKALRAKLDVLCEPPVALNRDDFDRIERAVNESKRSFVMAEYSCHRREILLARKLYRRGDIGRLLIADSEESVDGESPVCLQSSGSIGKIVMTTRLGVESATCLESSAHGISIGTELLTLSNGANARALNGNFGLTDSLRLIGESGIIEASRGRVRLTDCSAISEKSVSIRPEGFLLPGMTGDDFARSSAIDSFILKILGDSDGAERCIDFAWTKSIVGKLLPEKFNGTQSRPYGYNIERK